jgi:hypothetical protein
MRAWHLTFLAILGAALLAPSNSAIAGGKRPVVAELFTSQGCSSCPPADALLSRLADRKDVIALSLPITYWDMLGWKDTLASEDNTRRQKAYAQFMGRGGVYTPEMIIDGASDIVGSREEAIESAIDARAADEHAMPVSLSASNHELHVYVGAADDRPAEATVWLLEILEKASVGIRAGENEGRTMTYRNVVRSIKAVGIWKGQALTLDLPRNDLVGEPHDAVAIIVQQNGYGRILGAAIAEP